MTCNFLLHARNKTIAFIVQNHPVFSHLVLSCLALSCLLLSSLSLSRLVCYCLVLSCLRSCINMFCCRRLCYVVLSCVDMSRLPLIGSEVTIASFLSSQRRFSLASPSTNFDMFLLHDMTLMSDSGRKKSLRKSNRAKIFSVARCSNLSHNARVTPIPQISMLSTAP